LIPAENPKARWAVYCSNRRQKTSELLSNLAVTKNALWVNQNHLFFSLNTILVNLKSRTVLKNADNAKNNTLFLEKSAADD